MACQERFALIFALDSHEKIYKKFSDSIISGGVKTPPKDSAKDVLNYLGVKIIFIESWFKILEDNNLWCSREYG